jgi:hypothetical protein
MEYGISNSSEASGRRSKKIFLFFVAVTYKIKIIKINVL